MTDTSHETPALEMQLLTAQDGTAYLLPRAVVEAGRLTPEEWAMFREAEASGDVQGYLSKAPKGNLPNPRWGIAAGLGTGATTAVSVGPPPSAQPVIGKKQSLFRDLFGI